MDAEGNNVANDGLHDKALEGDAVVGEFLIAIVELEVIVEDEATLHIRGHRNAHSGRSRVVREDHSSVSLVRKVQAVAEEERAHKWKILKFAQCDGTLQQLPLLLQRVELVDELPRIRQEVMIVILIATKWEENDGK